MGTQPIDHADLAVSHLTGLWRDKPKWRAFVAKMAEAFDDMEPVLEIITQLDDVDALDEYGAYLVTGVNLNVLGARIGQSRRLTNAIPKSFFGWDDDSSAVGWGEQDDEKSGGVWWDGAALYDDTLVDDATYRVLIRLRRLKNSAKVPTFETIIQAILFVFPDILNLRNYSGFYALFLTEVTATVIMGIGRQPSNTEIAMLRYSGAFPKPAGVCLSAYWWNYGSPTFSFDDDPDPSADTWGGETDPDVGGVFAEDF